MNGDVRIRDGRVFTLRDGLPPDVYAELEKRSSRQNPTATCCGCEWPLFFQHRGPDRNVLYGYHFPGNEPCDANLRTFTSHPMSDEHKRQIECTAIAGERTGSAVRLEPVTTGKRRPDLIIGRAAFEMQHSGVGAAAVKDRTAAHLAAPGVEVVAWASDATADPPWVGRAPGYRYDGQRDYWRSVPDPSAVGVLGVQDVEMERFDGIRNGRYYERWRPRLVAKMMTIEDVVSGLVDRSLKPVTIDDKVRLITLKGDALWRGHHPGLDTTYRPPMPRAKRASQLVECDREPPVLRSAECIWCHRPLAEVNRTIHPACADERAIRYVEALAGRQW